MRLDCSGPRPVLALGDEDTRVTDAQRRALALDRDLVVSAGAGSGKTFVLSLRYVALMLEHAVDVARTGGRPDPERVLVLTFTEDAAEEMAERCRTRLSALADAARAQRAELEAYGPGFGSKLVAALVALKDGFEHARITTFHGFCARLLREFPAETGTPPGFVVLEPVEAVALRDGVLEESLSSADPDLLRRLLGAFGGRRRLLAALRSAVEERWRTEPILARHAAGAVTEEELLAEVEPSAEAVGRWLTEVARPLLSDLAALLRDAPPDSKKEPVRAALEALRDVPDEPLARFALYRRTLAALLTRDESKTRRLTHHAFLGRKDGWEKRAYDRARLVLPAVSEACADWPERFEAARRLPTPVDREMLAALRDLGAVALDAIAKLRDRLDRRGSLDFAELQHRAVRAVTGEAPLADLLRERHPRIMVDEFQDTDEAQWALVSAIATKGGVFIVGDQKQAIYGFRGGDVTVFSTAAEALRTAPIALPDNFRTRPSLIGFFNAVFADVLPAYEPLAAGRDAAGGTVTVLRQPATRSADDAFAEAEAVAAWAADQPEEIGTIAVLLRTRTRLGLYEHALRRRAVPYAVAKGVGFWERPEIVDLVNAMHALASGDPTSMVGWLRSPLLAVPDPVIFELARMGSLRELARGGPAPAAAADAVRRVRSLFAVRDRIAPSALLRRILDVCAGWHAAALADPSGQAEANVARLEAMISRLDARSSLAEVADWLLAQVESGAREPQAVLDPGAARVVVLTVHASKGLEFPVVVVPELGARTDGTPPPLALRRHHGRWAIACTAPDPEADVALRGRPSLYEALEATRRREEDAEARRLLYVAFTRARDHLVLVASIPEKLPSNPRPGVWLDALLAHEPLRKALVDGEVSGDLQVADVTAPSPCDPVVPDGATDAPPAELLAAIAPIEAAPAVEVSPSTLDLFESCPARWYRRHRLRIPEGPAGGGPVAPALGALRGAVLHGMLEDDLAEDEATALQRFVATVVEDGGTVESAREAFPDLLDHLRRAAADPWLRAVLDAPGHAETTFRRVHGHLVLQGQIDRLWFDGEADGWVVLDYKSEAVGPDLQAAAKKHERQLLAYAWAATQVLEAHGQRPVVRGEVYFTAVGRAVPLGPWGPADFARLAARLDEVAHVAGIGWEDVERLAARAPRPCPTCGYHRSGCRGSALYAT
jgi:ATP-dependent helicase/nuclease subunit A